jgi:hypothetical protein
VLTTSGHTHYVLLRNFLKDNISTVAWTTAILVSILAVIVWGESYNWSFAHFDAYTLFPLLGLLAFSIMWSHYTVGSLRRYLQLPSERLQNYFESTSFVVLALLLLHPGLLILQRFIDGFGFPPGSYLSYVGPGLGWVAILGTVSLLAFLLFELRRFYSNRSWWKYILLLNDAAMLAVFYHGLRLGGQLQISWYRAVWYFYGISLIGVILYGHLDKQDKQDKA